MKIFIKAIKLIFIVLLMELNSTNLHAQSGNVLDFDGINDFIQIPYNTPISQTNSFQLSVKVNSNTGLVQSILTCGGYTKGFFGLGYYGFELNANPDGHWYLLVSQGGANFIPIQGPAINYGSWTNIAATYDGVTVKLYNNGTLANSVAISGLTTAVLPTRIGAGNSEGSANGFLKGQTDNLSFWSRTLSNSEINSNMNNSLTGNESGLIAYYNFNEGIANGDNTTPPINTLNDLTTNNINGTLYNFALNGTSSNWVSASALPVNLVSFNGTKKDGYNLLQWSTASEQNTGKFEIQRSEDGNSFITIGTVSAAGNSDRILNYTYDDRSLAASPVYYYRLRMVDLDGSSKYSDVVSIKNSASQLATVYPNPARDQITITVADKSLLNSNAVLTDLNGKVMQKISLSQPSTTVNVSSYTRGMYVLKFGDGSSIKIVKE